MSERDPMRSLRKRLSKAELMRSGMLTTGVLFAALAIVIFLIHEHGKGHLHKLTTPAPEEQAPPPPQPGGHAALALSRLSILNGAAPEFTGTTILPGIGMEIAQLTTQIPLKGEVQLLYSPSLETFSTRWNQVVLSHRLTAEQKAEAMAQDGAPFLVSSTREPIQRQNLLHAALTLQAPETPQNSGMPDGGEATGLLTALAHPTAGQVPAGIELRTSTLLSGRWVELTITAQNHSEAPIPLTLGWLPHIALPKDQRSLARLVIPSLTLKTNSGDVSASGSSHDLTASRGTPLGSNSLDVTYTQLKHDFLSDGPQIELQNPNGGYTLRMTALSPNIRSLRVIAPAQQPWIILAPLASTTDTPGAKMADNSATVTPHGLMPGATFQWKVRLEVLPPRDTSSQTNSSPVASRELRGSPAV